MTIRSVAPYYFPCTRRSIIDAGWARGPGLDGNRRWSAQPRYVAGLLADLPHEPDALVAILWLTLGVIVFVAPGLRFVPLTVTFEIAFSWAALAWHSRRKAG